MRITPSVPGMGTSVAQVSWTFFPFSAKLPMLAAKAGQAANGSKSEIASKGRNVRRMVISCVGGNSIKYRHGAKANSQRIPNPRETLINHNFLHPGIRRCPF
ncbi:MAG TPA: hypothetical protein PLF10_09120 [Dokdonella sp.]|nr:hypothetical protein [Dokdonella sp.]